MGNYLDGYEKPVCGACGLKRTPQGHDGCIGTLPEDKVMNACCGHGEDRTAYVQFWDGDIIRGNEALEYQFKHKSKMKKVTQDCMGFEAQDVVTGLAGIVTGHAKYITGCDQYLIQPKGLKLEGNPISNDAPLLPVNEVKEPRWIDEGRLILLSETAIIDPESLQSEQPGADIAAPIK